MTATRTATRSPSPSRQGQAAGTAVATLGSGAELTAVFDQAPFVEQAIEGLTTEGVLGLLMAVLVILVFLLSLRSTLVTAVSIPLSVLIALIGLWIARLLAQHAHPGRADHRDRPGRRRLDRRAGEHQTTSRLRRGEARTRSSTAVREVAGAVTASTLTTVAVFLPIGLVGGLVGAAVRPFSLTVTVALLASLLVSLTVVPVLSYWFLKPGRRERRRPRGRSAARPRRRSRAAPCSGSTCRSLRFATRAPADQRAHRRRGLPGHRRPGRRC